MSAICLSRSALCCRAAAGRPGTAPVICLFGQCGRTPAPADRGRAYSSRMPTYFSRYMLHFVNLSAQNRLQLVHHRFARNYLAEWAGGSMDKPFYRSDHCTDHCSKRCPRRRFLGSSSCRSRRHAARRTHHATVEVEAEPHFSIRPVHEIRRLRCNS